MSFIVSYNGQFKPYKLPDLTYFDRIHSVHKADKNKSVKEHEEHSIDEQKSRKVGSNKLRNQINQYKEVDKNHKIQKKAYFARDIMSKTPQCLYTDTNLAVILEKMKKYNYRHFPILNKEERLVGIVSDRDVLVHLHKDHSTILAENLMTSEVLTALDNTRIQDISKIMLHEKINSIPIITDEHVLVGIITQSDILSFVTKANPIDLWS